MRRLIKIGVLVLAVWLGSFLWFVSMLPTDRAAAGVKTDAIIVLTGGNGRVEQGLTALADGRAPILLITGVGRNVTLPQMIAAHATPGIQQRIAQKNPLIILDYVASSTQSNAAEAARFVSQNQVHSVRLVTAHYHMPRSLIEFRAAMPDVDIMPDPVLPEVSAAPWWRDENMRRRIFSEYHKYVAKLFLSRINTAPQAD